MIISPEHLTSHADFLTRTCPGSSTMMLGEQSTSADYWKKCGDEALAHGVKGVVMMGAHWDATHDRIEVSMNPNPGKSPVAYVHPSKYVDYKLVPDLTNGQRCIDLLKSSGFNVTGNDTFEWIHDTYLVLIRMFPKQCLPTVIVSMVSGARLLGLEYC